MSPHAPAATDTTHLAARMQAFYGQAGRATVVNLLLGALATWGLHGLVAGPRLWAWAALVVFSTLLRWALASARQRDPQADHHALRWGWVAAGSLAVSGAVWGLGAPLLLAQAGPLTLAFWTVAVCGIAAGVVAGTTWFVPAQWAYLLPLLLPLVVVHAQRGGSLGLAAAGGLALYLVFCLAQGRALARALQESLAMRAENRALLAQVQAAAAARARFFAAASHDLRQPVQALVLMNAALPQTQGAERAQLLARMGEGITALDHLADALLDVARLEAGAGTARTVAVDLPAFLQALVARQAPAAAQRLVLRRAKQASGVLADPAALARVLSNLLTNACQHGGPGPVLLAARCGRGGTVRLQVRDGGPGIAAHHQQAVFEPFFQLGNPHRDRSAGSGLGLATARGLAQAMGGALTLRSAPGHGSCFELRLPAAPAPAGPPPAAPLATHLPRLRVVVVVVVEDDPLVREALATLLRQWGAEVTAVHTAAALPAQQPRPALLLCDRMLAGDDGLVQAADLQARWQPAPRTVLMSGLPDTAAKAAAQARGWIWLDKPVRPLALRACLEAAAATTPVAAP